MISNYIQEERCQQVLLQCVIATMVEMQQGINRLLGILSSQEVDPQYGNLSYSRQCCSRQLRQNIQPLHRHIKAFWELSCLPYPCLYQQIATTIWDDNSAALTWSGNPIANGRTKHITITYHYIRDLVPCEQKFKDDVELQK